jgi:small-conductance mechanosensitive channel
MFDARALLEFELFSIGGRPVNVATILTSFIVALVAILVARVGEKATVRFLKARGVTDEGSTGATARLVYYVVLGVGFAVAIHTLGINLTALFTAGAVLAIAIGFAMQNMAQNFVAGLILLIERTIKPGDILEVEGRMVKVTRLGMRATVTRTWDADDLIIPNSVLVSSTVKNFTFRDRLHRIRCQVGVSYDSDVAEVERVLREAAIGIDWRDSSLEPVILLRGFGDSSVNFDVSVWVHDPFARSLSQSDLNRVVWYALKHAGITIAYPQLDLHIDAAGREAIRGEGRGQQ